MKQLTTDAKSAKMIHMNSNRNHNLYPQWVDFWMGLGSKADRSSLPTLVIFPFLLLLPFMVLVGLPILLVDLILKQVRQ